jgi:Subtilisin inhibitor-like
MALLAGTALVALAACGGSPGSSGSSGAASSPAPVSKVALTVTVTPSAGATPEHWTLRCEPAGGTHPDPAAACRQLLAAKNPFGPIPRGIMCPMIAAGQGQATISGTYFGKHVTGTFSQTGGCSAQRWAQLGDVFMPVH